MPAASSWSVFGWVRETRSHMQAPIGSSSTARYSASPGKPSVAATSSSWLWAW